jgi:transcriptional regulator with XRE-family HTH domain
MRFNYNKLLGLMKEKQITQLELAKKLGITTPTLSLKLNNKARFKQSEIVTICDFLGIDAGSIGSYFFTV